MALDGKPCRCGSGEPMFSEYDARGIYLTVCCDMCRGEALSGFRADVLSDPDYWTDEPIEADQ